MGILIIPLLLLAIVAPSSQPGERELTDFERFSKAIGREIALVDRDGTVREGLLEGATADHVTMRFGSGATTFTRAAIVSAERLRDGRKDGAIKGAIFGAVAGIFAMQGFDSASEGMAGWAGSVAFYSAVGWALDAAQTHREPIYRAQPSGVAPPPVKLTLRF
jgi:hypothetical protein